MSNTRKPAPMPVCAAAGMIEVYAARFDVGTDEDEGNTLYLFHAMQQSICPWEICYIGCAMLARHRSRALPNELPGEPDCDPDLTSIRDALRQIGLWRL